MWWAHQDSNLEPKDYESSALTIELWARAGGSVEEPPRGNQNRMARARC